MGFVDPCIYANCCSYKDEKKFGAVNLNLKRKRRRKMAVHGKFERLQKLVPGGIGLQPDQLMVQTADYILHLKLQLSALQLLLKLQHQ